jgi:hypothetical protein
MNRRPTFGDAQAIAAARRLEGYAGRMAGVPLVALCASPRATRAYVASGRPGPCYRCLAYRPDLASGCHFVERGADGAPPPSNVPPAPAGLFDR